MTDEKNMTQETVRVPQRAPGFDPMKFAQETVDKAGEKVLTLELKHKKAWFRMACPNGGVVLNPLRVTDQMAIFEARLFADTDDRNPLASFTSTRTADKATGKGYIRAAQDDALSEALDNAGFGLPLVPMANSGGQGPSAPAVQAEAVPEAAGSGQPVEAVKQNAPLGQTAPPVVETAQQPKPAAAPTPRPAPVGPPPRAAETPRPAPVGPQPRSGGASVVNIATVKPAGAAAQPAVRQEQTGTATQPVAGTAPVQEAPVPAGEDAPIAYTADMTVEEISRLMTLEQAKKIKVQDGTCKGWTLEQVASDRPPSLKWLKFTAPFADNVLKAAAGIVLADLELKKAG